VTIKLIWLLANWSGRSKCEHRILCRNPNQFHHQVPFQPKAFQVLSLSSHQMFVNHLSCARQIKQMYTKQMHNAHQTFSQQSSPICLLSHLYRILVSIPIHRDLSPCGLCFMMNLLSDLFIMGRSTWILSANITIFQFAAQSTIAHLFSSTSPSYPSQ
jgi:hypothetical protein